MCTFFSYSVRNTLRLLVRSVIVLNIILLPFQLKAQLAEGHSKFLGNIIGYSIPDDFDYYWNQITAENSGKWGSVESTRNTMQWGSLDQIYDYAKDMEFPFKQHNFIWGQQQPSWIDGLDSAAQREEVEEWIQLFGERYLDTDFIDVVNEPFNAPPPYKNALGGNGETGWDWVIWAFEKAREYNPDAKLHINEWGILSSTYKTGNYIKVINLLKERDLIDGIGVQGHFLESANINTIKTNLDSLAKTGLPIYVTEYDVRYDPPDVESKQLAKYQEQFPVLWEHPGVKGITLWGYKEGMIWRTEAFLVRSDGTERPALEWLWEYMEETAVTIDAQSQPTDFSLCQNYPNPFNPETKISYQLPKGGQIRLEIYNLLGHKVKTLVNDNQLAGFYNIRWNALDESGKRVPSGVYLYQIKITDSDNIFTKSKKMLLLK